METKFAHTTSFSGLDNHPIIELFFSYAQLKNLYRQGWIKHGVQKDHAESVADHAFGVALLSYVIATEYRPDLDAAKTMQLGLFHEFGEIYGGDITPTDDISLDEKVKREASSVQKVTQPLSHADHYIALWKEFEDGVTPEAIFVKQIDRLEMGLQALLYEKLDHLGVEDYFPYVQERVTSPELKDIFSDVIRQRS